MADQELLASEQRRELIADIRQRGSAQAIKRLSLDLLDQPVDALERLLVA